MNDIYTRQESLGIVTNQTVAIVGCGGIGSWLGYTLALAGVKRLLLFDGDKIEGHNLNRLPFDQSYLGRYKSDALAELISKARPDCDVQPFAHFEDHHYDKLDEVNWVAVSTDTLRSRKLLYDAVRRRNLTGRNIGYIECGADGNGASVSGSPADWSTELEANPGYQSIPVFVGPCTLAASVAAYYILHNTPITDTFRVDWDGALKIQAYQLA